MNQNNVSLPSGCVLRKATSSDRWPIRLLVFSAKLDPTQLNWQQFWVIECDAYGGQSLRHLVACGQLRNFSGAQELGSLVVAPSWRGRGLGTLLTQHLINTATQPLYLESPVSYSSCWVVSSYSRILKLVSLCRNRCTSLV